MMIGILAQTAVGLTIDYDSDRLYWIVWEKNGVSLYRTDIDGPCSKSSPVHTLDPSTAIGKLTLEVKSKFRLI